MTEVTRRLVLLYGLLLGLCGSALAGCEQADPGGMKMQGSPIEGDGDEDLGPGDGDGDGDDANDVGDGSGTGDGDGDDVASGDGDGSEGGDGTPGDGNGDDSTHEDLGQGDGQDVITIGDSWMMLTGTVGIQYSLEKASGQTYRKYGVSGTRLLNGQIPGQYEQAKSENPDIKTVVMTGGGNDILQVKLLDCLNFNDACKAQIEAVGEGLVALWQQMADDGVQDVVLIGYTRKANILGRSLEQSADYSAEIIPPLCESAPVRCHLLESDDVYDGSLRDGIHPTDAGYAAIGAAVWDLMQERGVRR